jgi:hypothetical protein
MWKWFNCYLSGRHDFGVSCESGVIFLRCMHCGKRSSGWSIEPPHRTMTAAMPAKPIVAPAAPARKAAQPIPFPRVATR